MDMVLCWRTAQLLAAATLIEPQVYATCDGGKNLPVIYRRIQEPFRPTRQSIRYASSALFILPTLHTSSRALPNANASPQKTSRPPQVRSNQPTNHAPAHDPLIHLPPLPPHRIHRSHQAPSQPTHPLYPQHHPQHQPHRPSSDLLPHHRTPHGRPRPLKLRRRHRHHLPPARTRPRGARARQVDLGRAARLCARLLSAREGVGCG